MASILAPPQPPSMPPNNSPAPEGNHSDSRASSPERDNAMQVENHPPRTLQAPQQSTNPVCDDTPQPPPQSTDPAEDDDHMDNPVGDDTLQPPPQSTDPAEDDNHMDIDEEGTNITTPTEPDLRRSSRISKAAVNPDLNMQKMSAAPPSRKSKGKQPKKAVSITKTEPLQSRPLIIGSKYMQLRYIDLTQVEVSQFSLWCFWALYSWYPTSPHLILWSFPELP